MQIEQGLRKVTNHSIFTKFIFNINSSSYLKVILNFVNLKKENATEKERVRTNPISAQIFTGIFINIRKD